MFAYNFLRDPEQVHHENLYHSIGKSKFTEIVEELLKTKNYKKIIKSKELFWALYCSIQKKEYADYHANDYNIFLGLGIHKELQDIIEFIREQLVEFLNLKTESKLFYSGYNSIAQKLSNNDKNKHVKCAHFFVDYVLPCLEKLVNSVGFSYSCVTKPEVNYSKIRHIITLKNNLDNFLVSLIPPVKIENCYVEGFYNTYKKGKFVDFTLSAIGGEIKINSYFLYSRSTYLIKLMIDGNFQESESKHIHFSDYNISTINLYIEFLYLGSKILEKGHRHLLGNCDFTELINFAHVYEDTSFFDFCVNLFSYFSKVEQSKDLIEMSKYYNCDRLMDIYKVLNNTEELKEIENDKMNKEEYLVKIMEEVD